MSNWNTAKQASKHAHPSTRLFTNYMQMCIPLTLSAMSRAISTQNPIRDLISSILLI